MNNKIEIRTALELVPLEEKGKHIIQGKAIVYNQPEILYVDRFGTEYREMILDSALNNVDFSDVPLKYNHSQEKAKILARARQRTLILENRSDGLYFTAELNTNLGEDIYNSIKAGDIVGCSFGFICEEDEFDNSTNTRIIKNISKLTDVSVVDDPAYKQTYVEARSKDYFIDIENKKIEQYNKYERDKLTLLTLL